MDNTTIWYNSKYNCYGNLLNKVKDDIKSGDLVEYSYAGSELIIENDRSTAKKVIIKIQGIYNIEKTQFTDKKQTIVYGTHWLKLIK